MGDKTPKSKNRDQKQKDSARAGSSAVAKAKQDEQGSLSPGLAESRKS